jgi:hypothetical protein
MFGCDKALLRVFLEACDWPVGKDSPRQAQGLAQHHTMDVFEPIAALLPLQDIGPCDELATEPSSRGPPRPPTCRNHGS